MKSEMYYNCDKILSHNRIFNFVIGNRGSGKSYTFKRRAIRNFINKGKQFVYVRRYEKDLLKTAPTYFDDMVYEFPDLKMQYKLGKFYINDAVAGFPVAVSQFVKMKSVAFPDVNLIIFDEFISEDQDYIGGKNNPYMEPELCLNFYQSVARGYEKPIREDVQFVFIANSVSINNPYFIYFNIDKMIHPDTKILKSKSWVLEQVLNENIREELKKSQFGHLIRNTKYGSYAVDNEYYLDSNSFVDVAPESASYVCSLIYAEKKYGLWFDGYTSLYYMNEKVITTNEVIYSLDPKSHNESSLTNNPKFNKRLKDAFGFGLFRFANQRCKNAFYQYMNIK